MRADDIVLQLWAIVPTITDKFSDDLDVVSITSSGLVATVSTLTSHDLNTGDPVNVFGSKVPNPLTSLTQVDNIGSATTTNDHDLTTGFPNTTVDPITIEGATEPDYNGEHPLLSVPDRKNFTYQITGNPTSPATGAPTLIEDLKFGYNGLHVVTVTGTNTFTYAIPKVLGSPAAGDFKIRTRFRISAIISAERAEESYTKQGTDKLWAFVVLDQRVANKSRSTNTDGVTDIGVGAAFRQYVLHPFAIYVFFPTTTEIGARKSRDEANDLLAVFCSSVVGIRQSSNFTQEPYTRTVYDSDNFFLYNTAFYIHEYIFQASEYITFKDTAGIDFGVAFRDIFLTYETSIGEETFTDHVNLDEDS